VIVPLNQTLANACGFIGMGCIIGAYGYMTGAAKANPFIQHGVNLAGAALLVNTNPASLVLEGFWAAIAIWGLIKAARHRA